MDSNNLQQNMQSIQQAPVQQQPSRTATPMPQTPTNGNKKRFVLLIILLILIIGMGAYVFFVKNQLKTAQKAAINTSVVIPTAIPAIVIPATVEEIIVASPEAELNEIDNYVQSL